MPPRVTISLPHGLTIGGVTTWALNIARWSSAHQRHTTLIFHEALTGHQTFELPPDQTANDFIKVQHLPSIDAAFDLCVEAYAAHLPMVLLPNFNHASYRLAQELMRRFPDSIHVLAIAHGDNPQDYAYLTHFESIASQLMGVSRRCATTLATALPARKDDITALAHGVDLPCLQQRTSLENRPLRLLYSGRIEQGIKRVVDLLAIALLLAERGISFEFVLIGDGPHATMIDSRIAALVPTLAAQGSRIRRIDAVEPAAMSEWHHWADVFVLTSRLEGMNVAMLEAMAHGCVPIVSAVSSGVNEVIDAGSNGHTFPVGDVEAAAEQIAALTKNSQKLISLSRHARETIERSFDCQRYIDRFLRLIDRVWASPRRLLGDDYRSPFEGPTNVVNGAIQSVEDPRYQALVELIAARPAIENIVVYGLGVNGLTLLEHLRHDRRIDARDLFVADDQAHAAIFRVVGMPRVFPIGWPSLTENTLVVVTPNSAQSIVERLMGRGARPGVHFVQLSHLIEQANAIRNGKVTTS